jgi:lipid-binding SYLF domain-containing protein
MPRRHRCRIAMEISMNSTRRSLLGIAVTGAASLLAFGGTAEAASSARQIDIDAANALNQLFAVQPKARGLAKRAKGVLVFPKIYKGGFLVGGLSGNGVLRVGGRPAGYYNITAASFGLQAGAQSYSFAMFFMTDSALDYLNKSDGWAIGSGPSVVVVDKGMAANLTSTTLTQDVYAIPFGQKGLMAGIGLEGSKITHYHPA